MPPSKASPRARLPSRIFVRATPAVTALDRAGLEADLKRAAPALPAVKWRDGFLTGQGGRAFAAQLSGSRVRDPVIPDSFHAATPQDLEFEESIDAKGSSVSSATLAWRLYDGNRVAQAALALLPQAERSTDTLHLWVTRRLLGTYDKGSMRYHARYAVFGYPAVFSLLGLGLAPAPSVSAMLFGRELARRGADAGAIEVETDKAFPEERIDIDEPSTVTAAVASAVLQASAAASGRGPFCPDATCRLHDAHRKLDMRKALLGGKLCASHAELFSKRGRSA